jgi:hypothetical protein
MHPVPFAGKADGQLFPEKTRGTGDQDCIHFFRPFLISFISG